MPADYDFEGRAHLVPGAEGWAVVLTFGKHRGTALIDVPTHYLQWMIEQGFPMTSALPSPRN